MTGPEPNRSNDCEMMIMLKHNQHHQITFSICSSVCYNSAKQNLKLMIYGSRRPITRA